MPVTVIVPAFGMRAMPATLRSAVAVALVTCVLPGLSPLAEAVPTVAPTPWQLTQALVEGGLIAVPAALGLWIATMAGELYDELGDSRASVTSLVFEGEGRPTGVLFHLFAIISFLARGGPSRLAAALGQPVSVSVSSFRGVGSLISAGIGLAITLSGPLVMAAMLVNLAGLAVVRASVASATRSLILPLQGIVRLLLLALLLEWTFRAIALWQ